MQPGMPMDPMQMQMQMGMQPGMPGSSNKKLKCFLVPGMQQGMPGMQQGMPGMQPGMPGMQPGMPMDPMMMQQMQMQQMQMQQMQPGMPGKTGLVLCTFLCLISGLQPGMQGSGLPPIEQQGYGETDL